MLVEIKDMCKIYNPGENEVRALDGIDLTEGTKKTTEALKKASASTLNAIDILIGDSIKNEDAKK
mgnify:CR=1 FL=1